MVVVSAAAAATLSRCPGTDELAEIQSNRSGPNRPIKREPQPDILRLPRSPKTTKRRRKNTDKPQRTVEGPAACCNCSRSSKCVRKHLCPCAKHKRRCWSCPSSCCTRRGQGEEGEAADTRPSKLDATAAPWPAGPLSAQIVARDDEDVQRVAGLAALCNSGAPAPPPLASNTKGRGSDNADVLRGPPHGGGRRPSRER